MTASAPVPSHAPATHIPAALVAGKASEPVAADPVTGGAGAPYVLPPVNDRDTPIVCVNVLPDATVYAPIATVFAPAACPVIP